MSAQPNRSSYLCEPRLHGGRRVDAAYFVQAWPDERTFITRRYSHAGSYACCAAHLPEAVEHVAYDAGTLRPFITIRSVA